MSKHAFILLSQQRSNRASLTASVLPLLLRSKVNSRRGSSGAVIIKSTHDTRQREALFTSLDWPHFALTTAKQPRALPLLLALWKKKIKIHVRNHLAILYISDCSLPLNRLSSISLSVAFPSPLAPRPKSDRTINHSTGVSRF